MVRSRIVAAYWTLDLCQAQAASAFTPLS